ncbi:MAG TPA: hypothetical protein VFF15_07995 [Flavobacteriaceae bacterium]|nr:hypothetical protein [Flavobacteriaceae bacterium]
MLRDCPETSGEVKHLTPMLLPTHRDRPIRTKPSEESHLSPDASPDPFGKHLFK